MSPKDSCQEEKVKGSDVDRERQKKGSLDWFGLYTIFRIQFLEDFPDPHNRRSVQLHKLSILRQSELQDY